MGTISSLAVLPVTKSNVPYDPIRDIAPIVHSTACVGMPTTVLTVRMLERIAKAENRLAELTP